jgi:hypothetical protein
MANGILILGPRLVVFAAGEPSARRVLTERAL